MKSKSVWKISTTHLISRNMGRACNEFRDKEINIIFKQIKRCSTYNRNVN